MDSPKNGSGKVQLDIYQIVTDRIMTLLNEGVVPWQKPWTDAGPPINLLSKRPYRGINFWLLHSLPYTQNYFLTWEQVKAAGGSVNKDEKGHMIVFWKNIKKKPEEFDEKGNAKLIPMLRYYKVFNIEQCRDIPPGLMPVKNTELVDVDPLFACDEILNDMPTKPDLMVKGKAAYYTPETDVITMPPLKQFKSKEQYYGTLFHEIIHSTGHQSRLNRKGVVDCKPFGTPDYSLEELVAELGSAYLCHEAGILPNTISDSASYINNWLEVLKGDKRFIIQASGFAQKAADYVLNVQTGNDPKEEVEEPVGESVVG